MPLAAFALVGAAPATALAATDSLLGPIREQAAALAPTVRTQIAHRFLAAAGSLPSPPSRTIYRDTLNGAYFSEAEAASLRDSLRARLAPLPLDGRYFYQTRYGSILTYLRVVELLGSHGLESFAGKRVLDFGYGRIGHLRVFANLGASAVGVDVDPLLPALYAAPADQGTVGGFDGQGGSVALVNGWFPGDSATRASVGRGYDVVISKNTLKGGHEPAQRARQRRVVDLGVSDSIFVRAIFDCIKPGGMFLMYTISSPQGNGGCPFSDRMLRAAGFEILAYDQDDSPGARSMMRAIHWGQDQADDAADEESIATFTLLRRPAP